VSSNLVNLEEFFRRSMRNVEKYWLRKEKAILAVVLAHSLLHLHESPWMSKDWNTRQILVLEAPSTWPGDRSPSGYDLNRPYMATALQDFTTLPLPSYTNHVQPILPQGGHQNPCLLALGVILLELHMNHTIPTKDGGDARWRAMALLTEESLRKSMPDDYWQATSFCLYPQPDAISREFVFDDSRFRERYYEQVVMRLERHLDSTFEVPDDFWESL
jgi:hypothetical protein